MTPRPRGSERTWYAANNSFTRTIKPGFFAHFADDGRDRPFVVFHVSGRQTPRTELGVNRAPHEQHLALLLDERAHGKFGLAEKDKAARPCRRGASGQTQNDPSSARRSWGKSSTQAVSSVAPAGDPGRHAQRNNGRAASAPSAMRRGLTPGVESGRAPHCCMGSRMAAARARARPRSAQRAASGRLSA